MVLRNRFYIKGRVKIHKKERGKAMLIKIKCPKCETEGSLSLVESSYQGPYKCWKCRAPLRITIENNELKSCEPLSQEEFERLQEIEALKAKFKQRN